MNYPTRANTLLDLVLTSNRCLLKQIQAEPSLSFRSSYHVSLLYRVRGDTGLNHEGVLKPCFKKADWNSVYDRNCHSTEDYWSPFKNRYQHCII